MLLRPQSNPDVMTKFLTTLGMSPEWGLVDVIGLDPELLSFLPQPIVAIILLYPFDKDPSSKERGLETVPPDVYYLKQTISNACGTIALIHSIGNLRNVITFQPGSVLDKFFKETESMTPEERAKRLENDHEFARSHEETAKDGQTSAPALEDEVDHHFLAFVQVGGRLYELDGIKKGPVDHGPSSPDTFAVDSGKVCQEIMAKNPDLHYTAVAVVKAET